MSTTTPPSPCPERSAHKRSRSAVLKSFVMPSSRTPSPTKSSPTKQSSKMQGLDMDQDSTPRVGRLAARHPNTLSSILRETSQNSRAVSRSPQKQTTNTKNYGEQTSVPDPIGLSNPMRIQPPQGTHPKEKENTSPSHITNANLSTPIWAQFAKHSSDGLSNSQNQSVVGAEQGQKMARISTRDFATTSNGSTNSSQASYVHRQDRIWDDSSTRPSSKSSATSTTSEQQSKVRAKVTLFNNKSQSTSKAARIKPEQLNSDFEAVLTRRNIPESMRQTMMSLDPTIKADFIRHSKEEPTPGEEPDQNKSSIWNTLRRGRAQSSAERPTQQHDPSCSPSKRSRSKGRVASFKDGASPSKRARSNSRPRSLFSLRNLSSSSVNRCGLEGAAEAGDMPLSPNATDDFDSLRRPGDFVQYLQETSKIDKDFDRIEEAKMKKLRSLLRSESVSWVDTFILKDGMHLLVGLFERLKNKDWRETHDDKLLHLTLLCIRAVCTTQRAMEHLAKIADTVFPNMLAMLFSEERKGPSEFNTRGVIISLLLEHLRAAPVDQMPGRAKAILSYLADPRPGVEDQPIDWLQGMRQTRPYLLWCKEFTQVTREVFWMFTHRNHVIPLPATTTVTLETSYLERHFPKTRPPEGLNPWVGGVEWDTANYLTAHADLMLALIASLPTREERNQEREGLRVSGFEKALSMLRTCKEKFYAAPHDAIRAWVAAAIEDGWNTDHVRMEPDVDELKTPSKSPLKKDKLAPRLELLDIDLGKGDGDVWCD